MPENTTPQQPAPVSPLPPVSPIPTTIPFPLDQAAYSRATQGELTVSVTESPHMELMPATYVTELTERSRNSPGAYRMFLALLSCYNSLMRASYRRPALSCSCQACRDGRNNALRVRRSHLICVINGINVLTLPFITGGGSNVASRAHRERKHINVCNWMNQHRNPNVNEADFLTAMDLLDRIIGMWQLSQHFIPERGYSPIESPPHPSVDLCGHGLEEVIRIDPTRHRFTTEDMRRAAAALNDLLQSQERHIHVVVVWVVGMGVAIVMPSPRTMSTATFLAGLERNGATLEVRGALLRLHEIVHTMQRLAPHPTANQLGGDAEIETRNIQWTQVYPQYQTITPDMLTAAPPPPAPQAGNCAQCGRRFRQEHLRPVARLSLYNPPRFYENATLCEGCRSHHFNCTECEQEIYGTRGNTDSGGRICSRCYEDEDYRSCSRCGLFTLNADEDGHCESCASNGSIRSYSEDPDTRPRGGAGPRYFGIELEVVAHGKSRNKVAQSVTKWWKGDAICKNDGSLPDSGFEIVTSPGTLAWHRSKWIGFLGKDRMASGAANMRSFQEQQCGLHIHYSKHSVSDLTRGRLIAFMNNPMNEPLISAVAGRLRNSYCRTETLLRIGNAVTNQGTQHYSCTNLCNHNTDEIRVFKGTLNLKRVLMYLDFTDGLLDYCAQPLLPSVEGKAFVRFKAFVLANESKWPYLHRYFQHGDAWLKRWAFDPDRLLEIPAASAAAVDE